MNPYTSASGMCIELPSIVDASKCLGEVDQPQSQECQFKCKNTNKYTTRGNRQDI